MFLLNFDTVLGFIFPHTSYIPASHLAFLYDLVRLILKGDFATVDHGVHAAHAHRQGLQPNELPHRDENPKWLAAFNFPDFRV